MKVEYGVWGQDKDMRVRISEENLRELLMKNEALPSQAVNAVMLEIRRLLERAIRRQ